MYLPNIYFYYLPTDLQRKFQENIKSIAEIQDREIVDEYFGDWNAAVNARCPIPVLINYLERGPTGCPHCEIEQVKSYQYSQDPEERKEYLQYLQIKNDAHSFWDTFRSYISKSDL
jgi:hypothetical protein